MDQSDPFDGRPIKVGIVGANPDRSWAARAHVPAILASPELVLAAVATTQSRTAEAAKRVFGAQHAFDSAQRLVDSPDVDLVVVSVKVPEHGVVINAALRAGKNVYCEWPLARNLKEAEAMHQATRDAGVRGFVGLQSRYDPAISHARALIRSGALGTVLSATLYSARSRGNTRAVPGWSAYTYRADQGAGLVDVVGGHALDLAQHLLGPIEKLTAHRSVRSPDHTVAETGRPIEVTAADHLTALAHMQDGAEMTVHIHDAESAHPRTRIEIAGTLGDLALVSTTPADPIAAQLQINGYVLYQATPSRPTWTPLTQPDSREDALPVQARNLSRLYGAIVTDLRCGTQEAPSFDEAVQLHRLLRSVG